MSASCRLVTRLSWPHNSSENCQTVAMTKETTSKHPLSRVVRAAGLAAIAAFAFASCSSDSSSVDVRDLTTAGGVTLPDIGDIPGVTDECQRLYLQFAAAMVSAFVPTGQAPDYQQLFGDVAAKVPAELQDEIVALSVAFQQYGAVLNANNGDFTSADVQAAIQGLNTPEISGASEAVNDYFAATCPTAG